MVTNDVLRRNARSQLGNGIFNEKWLMMLVCCLIQSLILGLSGTGIGAIVTIIASGPLTYGLCKVLTLALRSNQKANLNMLFSGFTEAFGDSIILWLLQTIFICLWSLLFVIPGIIKAYSYSMASFLQQDNADKNWKTNLDQSKQMMDGHKMQLFLLDLSFIGWYLLGALCLGIGTLFVVPYHQMARANFYEALRAECNLDN